MAHTKSRRGIASFTTIVTLIAAGALMLFNNGPESAVDSDTGDDRNVTFSANWQYTKGARVEWGVGFPPANKRDFRNAPVQKTERVTPGQKVSLRVTLTSDARNDFLYCAITANNRVYDSSESGQYLRDDRHVCLVQAVVN